MDLKAFALPPLLLALAGCLPFGLGGQEEKPRIPLGNETVVVLPFKMARSSYFDSQVGARFSREIARWMRIGCPKANVFSVDQLPKGLIEEGAKAFGSEDVMEDSALVRVGERLKADFILVGEIHELRAKNAKDVNVLRGTMVLSARVAHVPSGRIVWGVERKTCYYPPRLMGEEQMFAEEKDEHTVLEMTIEEAARNIASVFAGREKLFPDERR